MANIVYYCYGSAHSSIMAAHIHLGDLPSERIPSKREIRSLVDFDTNHSYFIGTLYYKGMDNFGNQVYTMGMGEEMDLVKETFLSMLEHTGGNRRDYHFFCALPHINRLAKTGGALSRRYGLVTTGRRMVIKGIQQSYPNLVKFVQECKKSLHNEQINRQ